MASESHIRSEYEFFVLMGWYGLRAFRIVSLHKYVQYDEETNIYIGMHVNAFRSMNTVCRS